MSDETLFVAIMIVLIILFTVVPIITLIYMNSGLESYFNEEREKAWRHQNQVLRLRNTILKGKALRVSTRAKNPASRQRRHSLTNLNVRRAAEPWRQWKPYSRKPSPKVQRPNSL
jgi:hypothetical protein